MRIFKNTDGTPDHRDPLTFFVLATASRAFQEDRPSSPGPSWWQDLDITLKIDGHEVDCRGVVTRMDQRWKELHAPERASQAKRASESAYREFQAKRDARLAVLTGIGTPPGDGSSQLWQRLLGSVPRVEAPARQPERRIWQAVIGFRLELRLILSAIGTESWQDVHDAYERAHEVLRHMGQILADRPLDPDHQ